MSPWEQEMREIEAAIEEDGDPVIVVTAQDARLQLDRLSVSGSLVEADPIRRPYIRAGLGWVGLLIAIVGAAIALYGIG